MLETFFITDEGQDADLSTQWVVCVLMTAVAACVPATYPTSNISSCNRSRCFESCWCSGFVVVLCAHMLMLLAPEYQAYPTCTFAPG